MQLNKGALPIPKTLFPFIWHFLKEHKKVVLLYIILCLLAGFWGPINSLLIKQLIDLLPNANDGNVSSLLLPAGLIVLNFIIFDNVTWRSINFIWAKYVPIIQNKIISSMTDYSLRHSHGFYQNNLSGKISKQITNLSDSIVTIITFKIANFLRCGSLLIAAFITSYFAHQVFCIILVCWFIIFAGFSISMSSKIVSMSDNLAEEETKVSGEIVDSLSNHSNIKLFGRLKYEQSRIIPILDNMGERYSALYIYSNIIYIVQGVMIAMMMGFSTFFLVYLYGKGLVTTGDFALILGLCMETGHMIWYLMGEIDEFNKAYGKCKQTLISLIIPLEIEDKPNASCLNCKEGKIKFESVEFHYKGTEALFQNKSIEIKAGQKVGLVGYSGSGKSTFVNLILRLYDV
ncbi:MAG: ABC transporter ATP-binding protein, partial [Rickettsiaceae bacterium]|nr:ABC transporter ATP-binding protein [Rickettsiaceae bacterium]